MKTAKYLVLAILGVTLLPSLARGQELVGGWEGGPSYGYAFVSPIFTIPSSGSNMFLIRPTISDLYYNFHGTGGFTDVTAPGGSIQFGYRLQTKRLTLSLGPGVEVLWQQEKLPNGQTISATLPGATAEADAFFQATPLTNLNVISSFETAEHYFWTRIGAKHQITNTDFTRTRSLSIGAEADGQGNHNVHQFEGGGLFEVALPQAHSTLQFRAGYAHLWFVDGSTDVRPYFGVSIYHHF